MSELANSTRDAARSRRHRSVRPAVEGLEDRMLLYSVTGDHFLAGSRITWSIMPDGTSLGGIPSNLVSTLNQRLGSGNWINAVSAAFAQWENVANVNFAQVTDNGTAFGSGSYEQGDPNMGDIRIGGFVESGNTLAFAMLPPKANGSSDSGDILLNTAQPWHVGTDYDLETVLLHEIGHALGMGHSTDPNAVMYAYYGGVQQNVSSDDITGVQSIWSARQEDPFVLQNGNLSLASAVNVTSFMNNVNEQVYLPGLDVANSSETYWYKVTTPLNASNVFTAQVQSSNLSELSPKVSVYNASGKGLVQTSAASNSYGATINATISNATPNTTYYVKVQGSNSGDTGAGAYALTINMGYNYIGAAQTPNTVIPVQPDHGGGYEQMTMNGPGSWLKQWVMSDGTVDLAAEGITLTPSLIADLNKDASLFSGSGNQSMEALDAALAQLLRDETGNLVSAAQFVPLFVEDLIPLSKNKVQTILAQLLSEWHWV